MSPDRLYESAKQALIIASQLGQKVVVIGTSTGGTLALMLAADFPDKVNSLVLYSPNIQIKQKSAQFLSMPWGLQIARLNFGGDFRVTDDDPNGEICKYWRLPLSCRRSRLFAAAGRVPHVEIDF